MATRKAICLVSGLFQEVNTPTDKLDFAGNLTTDLAEGTNLYFTTARARNSVSAGNTGTGYGSLSYNSSTGVFTYSVVTDANIRGALSVAVGSGLTYNSSTGQFGTSAIPNSQLANSSITLGSTSVSLGATASTVSGLTSLSATSLTGGTTVLNSTTLTFSGGGFTSALGFTTPTANRTINLPDASGTVALLNSLSVSNSGTGFGSISYNSGTGVLTYNVVTAANVRGNFSASNTGTGYGSLTYNSSTGNYDFAVVTDANIRGAFSVAVGSGLTYNSSTGQFGTSAIPNAQLANSSITIGSSSVALGSTASTISGLTSLSSTSLLVGDGTAATPGLRFASDLNVGLYRIGNDQIGFSTNGTHAVTIDDSQRLLIGSVTGRSTFSGVGGFNPQFQVEGTGTNGGVSSVVYDGNDGAGGILLLGKSRGTTTGSNTVVQSGDTAGALIFLGADGTSLQSCAAFSSEIDGTPGTTSMPGRLLLQTSPSGSGTPVTRVIVNSTGDLILNDNREIRLRNSTNTNHIALVAASGSTTNRTITFPDATGTVLLNTSTLPSTFSDSTFRVQDNADATKQLAFECSGISTATTRTMTVPNENGTISTQDFATAIAIALG